MIKTYIKDFAKILDMHIVSVKTCAHVSILNLIVTTKVNTFFDVKRGNIFIYKKIVGEMLLH